MSTDRLTDEQMVAAKACKTADGLSAAAKKADQEMSEDELGAVAGGALNNCLNRRPHDNPHCNMLVPDLDRLPHVIASLAGPVLANDSTSR